MNVLTIDDVDQSVEDVSLSGSDFSKFKDLAMRFGSKAAGLLLLPRVWVPEYLLVPVSFHREWKSNPLQIDQLSTDILEWMNEHQIEEIIIRSSGSNETIDDRGKYQSKVVDHPCVAENIRVAINSVLNSASKVDPDEDMGLIVQRYVNASVLGHLSNEVRHSPTRNQWKYEVEFPWAPTRGLNSKNAPLPDATIALQSGPAVPHQSLRAVGKWICNNVKPRSHLEWLCADGKIWLVQLDMEWMQLDNGVDPSNELVGEVSFSPDLSKLTLLEQYEIGAETPWKKLKNLSDFDFDVQDEKPIIFQLPGQLVNQICDNEKLKSNLVAEILGVTNDRVVVRTDCSKKGYRSFNLPRTDTVSAVNAVSWCEETLKQLHEDEVEPKEVMFLLHAFLPSFASAWAYAKQGSPVVIVDALWGLPDGMQVLPVDSYEVVVPQKKVIDTNSVYKPRYLTDGEDGSWKYCSVLRKKGRSRVLKKSDILSIATRTRNIANTLGEDAQIMWFCGIPENYGVGRNLPWFRAREQFDTAPRVQAKFPEVKVEGFEDLERLPERQATIRLVPDANLIRDDSFLEKVIETALARRLPVKLEGSMLAHIYYRLCEAGVGVVVSNLPKYHRKRGKREFGKIVRDKIPENISVGGEEVVEAILDKEDALHGLAAKVIEELEEFIRAQAGEDKIAELADVFEVVLGLATNAGISWPEVEASAISKREKRGGFDNRKILIETSLARPEQAAVEGMVVSLDQLSKVHYTASQLKIPLTALMNSIGRHSVSVNIGGVSLALKVEAGHLVLDYADSKSEKDDPAQGSLFD